VSFADILGFLELKNVNVVLNANDMNGRKKMNYIPDWTEREPLEKLEIKVCRYCKSFTDEIDEFGWCPLCQQKETDEAQEGNYDRKN
jgi:hypothetical protein